MNVGSLLRSERRNAGGDKRPQAPGNGGPARADGSRRTDDAPVELSDRPEMREALDRYERVAQVTESAGLSEALPSGLVPAPGHNTSTATLDAAGFVDLHSRSVGVDIACWHAPPKERVDEHGWRTVFSWVVTSDRELQRVSLLHDPCLEGLGFVASYGYEAEGVAGVGVLRVSSLPAGGWRIVDCWGDAAESERVHHLAQALTA